MKVVNKLKCRGVSSLRNMLHLCSYYPGSKVYSLLIKELRKRSEIKCQIVFIPTRSRSDKGNYPINDDEINFLYCRTLSCATRFSFLYKQLKLRRNLSKLFLEENLVDRVNLVHAHTLYTDGFLAYFLYLKYKIPYVVTIRSTDINLFYYALPHWRFLTRKVLTNAKKVVYLSPSQEKIFSERFLIPKESSVVVQNGIEKYWIKNIKLEKKNCGEKGATAVYVGAINRNKNLKKTIVAYLRATQNVQGQILIIGGSYEDYVRCYGELGETFKRRVRFLGVVNQVECLAGLIAEADVLILASYIETFGLVYIEAVSQCVPVVYTKGQGIDGYFQEGVVGFSCNPKEIASIESAVIKTLDKFPNGLDFKWSSKNPAEDFSWEKVSEKMVASVYK